ncbi:MAG: DUF4336 domain-containing protein [Xanthobacteraceae bacterium]
MAAYAPYEPINTLKPIADNVWIVDGPEIFMCYPWLSFIKVPFPTRMTIVRLADGKLWVHSPTPLPDDLARAIDSLGQVAFLVAPNLLHYWWIGEWKSHYPQARAYAAPGVRERAAARFNGFDADLTDLPPPEWQGEFDQVLVPGDYLTEAVFLHRASRTLLLTDLIENFEPGRFRRLWMRWACQMSGCCDPDGKVPIDLRSTFLRHRDSVRKAVHTMLAWQPLRVILAHGRWYPDHAEAELRRAFRWVV